MDELLAAVAELLDAPAEMVERSAEARAKADGVSVEDVLTAWSGGEAVPAAAAPAAAAPAPEAPAAPAAPAAPTAPVVPRADDEGSLIAAAAVKMNMPESMIRRSAAARAKAAETDVQSVLMEWAGVDPDAPLPPVPEPAAAEPVAKAPAPATAPAAPAASGLDAAAILAAAAEKMGMPESMVERSAGARAKAQGVDVATVLAEWAGVDAAAAPAAPAATPAPAAATPAPAAPAAPEPAPEAATEPEEPSAPDEPVAPVDEFESEEEAARAGALPRWLAALFIVIPAIAIGYALFLPNGPNCGDAGSLAVDPVTGLAVNCDGSEYGSEDVDLFSLGMSIYEGSCSACHGPNGAGVANFPGFTGGALLATFPQDSCSAQIEWIALGTTGWPDAAYGANETPVGGSGAVMPGFAANLSPQELAGVALYERVAFGGQDIEAATVDCAGSPAAALGG